MRRLRWKQNNQSDFKACLKKPIKFQENERQVSCDKFCNFCFQNSYFPPPPPISNRLSTASIKIIELTKIPAFGWFRNGCNKVVIEPCVVQFWSEITLVITNGTRTARLFDFKITHITHIALTHLSCSPNFPRALYLDERTLTYEPIVNYLALSSISSISFLSFFLLLSRFWSFRYQHLVNFTNGLTNETSNSLCNINASEKP